MSERIVVCLACCRPESFKVWYSKWKYLFNKHSVDVIVSWDTEVKTPRAKGVKFLTRDTFPRHIPKGSSACRSAAVKYAYDIGYDIYIFLDDDVFPWEGSDQIQAYIDGFQVTPKNPGYYDVGNNFLSPKQYTRGFPYKERHMTPVVAQYGGWDNVPDLDARDTKIEIDRDGALRQYHFEDKIEVVPKYQGFTGCFMNCAFRHEVVPCLYHLYMGTKHVNYDRFDDIWAGLILKRVCDHMGWTILINGKATCWHDRASNPVKSVFQEQVGHKFNEDLWDDLMSIMLYKDNNVIECYDRLKQALPYSQIPKARDWIESFK